MKIISWNFKGLGSPHATRALLRLICVKNLDVIFIMESRLKKEEVQLLRYKCGLDNCLNVDCRVNGRDKEGCLILMWKEFTPLSITSFSNNHIRATVVDVVDNKEWFLNGIYGYLEEQLKKNTWILIQDLVRRGGDRVLCFRGLNDVIMEQENTRGNSRSSQQLSLGRQTMDLCGILDLGFEGYPFTWTNGRKGSENIQRRQDKAIASNSFINCFSPLKVIDLPKYDLDHAIIRIVLETEL